MAETCGIRVRLEFQALNEIERCWYFVDFSKFKNIKRLRRDIRNRFHLANGKVDMYIDDYLLISEEPIRILRDNDLITVKQSQRNLAENETASNVEIDATETKELRREKNTRAEEREKNLHLDDVLLEPKKKRRRKRKAKPSDETSQNMDASEKIIFIPRRSNATSKHKYFDCEEKEETFDYDDHPDDSASKKKTTAVDHQPEMFPSLALDERKSFADCPPLVGTPRVGDLIAYKELILSSDYTPQVSSYRVGKAISYCDGYIALRLINKSPAPRLKGKFDICFDDEIDKDSIDQEPVVVSVSTLIEPKLVNHLF